MTQRNYPNLSRDLAEFLGPRKAEVENELHEEFHTWCVNEGKNPEYNRGMSERTAGNYVDRINSFKLLIYTNEDCHVNITADHAESFLEGLKKDRIVQQNGETYAGSTKRKHVDAVRKYFDWRASEFGEENWDTDPDFQEKVTNQPDEFTVGERQILREAAYDYNTIPHYRSLSPEDRDRWEAHLAQRLEKPKKEVTQEDWEQATSSWKETSLIHASLDAGLRPCEIKRSTVDWLRLEKRTMIIPKEHAAKNRNNWEVALLDRTVRVLGKWLEEKKARQKYDGRDNIWLTREGNPYGSSSLNYLLDNLLEETGIETEKRDLKWYSIRHSLGSHMTSEAGLSPTKDQMRHESIEQTKRYADSTTEERRDSLSDIG
jgi:site-specific recombinase XerD